MNHVAHSEASKAAKTSDANLRNKISDLEQNNTRLDAELRRCVFSLSLLPPFVVSAPERLFFFFFFVAILAR